MKNTLRFLGLFMVVTLMNACSSSIEDDLQGTWIITSVSSSNCDDSDDNGTVALNESVCTDPMESCTFISFTFDDGNLTTLQSFSFFNEIDTETSTGPYELMDDDITLCVDGECLTFNLNIDGNQMTLSATDSEEFDGCDVTYNLRKE